MNFFSGTLSLFSLFRREPRGVSSTKKTKKQKTHFSYSLFLPSLSSLFLSPPSLSCNHPPDRSLPPGPVPSDVPWPPPHYEWWNAIEVENGESEKERGDGDRGGRTFEYRGFEDTLNHVAAVLDSQGPFDGFLAFSQGTILASLLLAAWSKADEAREREREREAEGRRGASSPSDASTSPPSASASASAAPLVLPPRLAGLRPCSRPRFAVLVSGVWAKAPICSALEREEGGEGDMGGGGGRWTRRESSGGGSGSGSGDDGSAGEQQQQRPRTSSGGCIRAPSLHVIGQRDYVSPLSRRLARAFANPVVVEHPGGHAIPRLDPASLATLRAFLASQQQASASSL